MEEAGKVWIVIGLIAIGILILAYGYIGITGKVVSETINENAVKVGFMAPLTGDAASYGQSIKNGVNLALEDSDLENVKIIYEDSGCDGKTAASVAQKLINVDRVSVIIGEVCSGATLASAPIAESGKVVMISSSSTSPKITDAGKYIFRTVPSDTLQGDFSGNLIYNQGHKKLAILYPNEDYGIGLESVLRESFKNLGGQIVSSEAFERGSTDMRTSLNKIKSQSPDAIYLISNSLDSAVAALKQIKDLEINSTIFGSEGLKSPEIAKTSGAEGLIITSVSGGTLEFASKYKKFYGDDPGPFSAQAYDAFIAISSALKKGAFTGTEIRDQLYQISFDGASGFIKFDENGDVSGNYEVYEVRNEEFVLVK